MNNRGIVPHTYRLVQHGKTEVVEGGVIEETTLSLYINGQDLATIMCSPLDEEALALGFLYNEGVIESLADVALIQTNALRTGIDIFLTRSDFTVPRRLVLTSGCGGGTTLDQLTATYPALESALKVTPDLIFARMRDLQAAAHLYNRVRGVHTAILATPEKLVVSAEDIGRHNTLDKLAGKSLQAGHETTDNLIITSGRISSEMVTKARRMRVPIIASRTAPTSTAVTLAQSWNMTLIGYVRSGSLRVYTADWRV